MMPVQSAFLEIRTSGWEASRRRHPHPMHVVILIYIISSEINMASLWSRGVLGLASAYKQ